MGEICRREASSYPVQDVVNRKFIEAWVFQTPNIRYIVLDLFYICMLFLRTQVSVKMHYNVTFQILNHILFLKFSFFNS